MTSTTTPAPMTHGGDDVFIPKPCCIRADGACFEEGECLSDCEALDRDLLRGASERELRQRLERAERDRNDWRTRAEALEHDMAGVCAQHAAMLARAEEAEARAEALAAEVEQLRVQLAGCGVIALCNTRESLATHGQIKPGDYGWSASLGDCLRAAEREIAERERAEAAEARIAELEAVVGRCERLATTFKLIRGDELRTALRGQRADTGRTEG